MLSLAFQGATTFTAGSSLNVASRAGAINMAAAAPTSRAATWDIKEVSPDGSLVQRVEGKTRKTWGFNDVTKDRVQLAVTSEGRPVDTTSTCGSAPTGPPSR